MGRREGDGGLPQLVGRPQYIVDGSGFLVNRNPIDLTPVLLTAQHQGIGPDKFHSLVVKFGYDSYSCGGDAPDPFTLPTVTAQTVLAEDALRDHTLLGLSFDLPGGVAFAGWDSSYWYSGYWGWPIHHPRGSFKRIGQGTKIGDAVFAGRDVWAVRFEPWMGLTEEGSSGSPVFDTSRRVRGLVTGTYGVPTRKTTAGSRTPTTSDALISRFRCSGRICAPYDPIYVNAASAGTETGSSWQPFNRLLEGMYAVPAYSHVYITAGDYPETFTVRKAMTLHAVDGAVVVGHVYTDAPQ